MVISKRGLWAIGGILVTLGICGGLSYLVFTRVVGKSGIDSYAHRYEENKSRALAAGVPASADDLRPKTPVPDAQNARQAIEELVTLDAGGARSAELGALREAVRAEDFRATEAALRNLGDFIAPARAAGSKETLYIDWDYDQGASLLFPQFASMRSSATILGATAWIRASRGDVDGCIADLTAARNIGNQALQQPFLIGALVGVAIHAINRDSLMRSAEALSSNPVGLRKLRDWSAKPPNVPPFRETLRGEAYFTVVIMRQAREGGIPQEIGMDQLLESWQLRLIGPKFFVANESYMYEFWAEALEEAERNPEGLSAFLYQKDVEIQADKGLSSLCARIMIPVFPQAVEAMEAMKPLFVAERTMIEALMTKQRTGKWPTELALPDDPFGEGPLKWKAEGDTLRVWSVGRDGEDDGGALKGEDGDVIVEVTAKKRR